MAVERKLRPLAFHVALASALQELEPGLWRWFSSDSYGQKYADTVKVELLRATYRLPQDSNAGLYQIAKEAAAALELDVPLTLYQAQEDGLLNAGLVFVPSEAHVVLRGPVAEVLSEGELRALFGHELAHHKLWTEGAGTFRTAESLIEHMATHEVRAAPSHVQSALRQRRWTEIYCDRGSLLACHDLSAAVACLVKMTTGLRQVDAKAYVAQAEESIRAASKQSEPSKGSQPSESATHPEVFIRAFALKSWDAGDDESAVKRLVEGPCEIEALDLVQQLEFSDVTEKLVKYVLAPEWMRTDATLAHARRFFPDFTLNGAPAPALVKVPDGGDGVAEYVCYLLLDFGMADHELEELSLAHALRVARELDLGSTFAKIARKELRLSAASYEKLEKRALAAQAEAEVSA